MISNQCLKLDELDGNDIPVLDNTSLEFVDDKVGIEVSAAEGSDVRVIAGNGVGANVGGGIIEHGSCGSN